MSFSGQLNRNGGSLTFNIEILFNTIVTMSTEDGEICLLRSSTVRSHANAFTLVGVKSLCVCNK